MAWGHNIYTYPPGEAYWNAQSFYSGTNVYVTPSPAVFGFSVASLVWTRPSQDSVQIDFDFAVHPSGGLCAQLDPATQMPQAETALLAWWTTMKPIITSDHTLSAIVWHSYTGGKLLPGPAVRITAVGVAGTNGGFKLPDQVALTCTFRTASRRHWGRVYLPGLTVNAAGLGGYVAQSSTVDVLATATNAMHLAIDGYGWGEHGVASVKYAGFLSLDHLAVDNIPDVMRSRRIKHPTYTKVFP